MNNKMLNIQIIIILCFILFGAFGLVPPVPKGSHPRFIAQLDKLKEDWNKLVQDAKNNTEPSKTWYNYILNHANSDAAVPSPWLTRHTITAYRMTGDKKYAQLAWSSALGNFINKYTNYDLSCCKTQYSCCSSSNFYGGENNARIIGSYWIDIYDWIYDFLSPQDRAQFRDKLGNLYEYIFRGGGNCCNYNQYSSWPLRSTDMDVTIHNYFALLKYYAATADESPHAGTFWNDPTYNLGGVTPSPISPPYGGRCQYNCYNASDIGINMRTSVKALLTKFAAGGTGLDSTGYNLVGTTIAIVQDWAACYTAFGVDYFPELPDYFLNNAMQYITLATPDLQWIYRWGDDEASTNPLSALYLNLGVISSTTSWFFSDPRQDQIRDFMKQIFTLWGGTAPFAGPNTKQWNPYDNFFFVYQHTPNATVSDFKQAFPTPGGYFSWDIWATGTYRTGWTPNDSLFGFEFAPYSEIDHFTQHVGNFQLYRQGEWGAYTPISYGRPTSSGEVTNTMSFYGWPDGRNYNFIREFKGIIDVSYGSNYAFFIGANAGTHRYNGAWNTPPTWQQEYTRSVLYLPGSKVDSILIFDRTNIIDPKTAANWTLNNWWGSNPKVAALFSGEPRKKWQWHCHQSPTIDAANNQITWKPASISGTDWTSYTWKASTKQSITLKTHFTPTTFNDPMAETLLPSQLYWTTEQSTGFLSIERPSTDQNFDATLHIFSVYNNAAIFSSKEYISSNSIAKGVLLAREGNNNVVAFYNVQIGPTIPNPNCGKNYATACAYDSNTQTIVPTQHYFKLTDNFSFSGISITTSVVDLYLHDLNPAVTYSVFVDSTTQAMVSVLVGGFIGISLQNVSIGDHTFCIEPANAGVCGTTTNMAITSPPASPTLPTPKNIVTPPIPVPPGPPTEYYEPPGNQSPNIVPPLCLIVAIMLLLLGLLFS